MPLRTARRRSRAKACTSDAVESGPGMDESDLHGRRGVGAIRRAVVVLGMLAGFACTRPGRLEGQRLELHPVAGLQLPTRLSLREDGLHVRQKFSPFVGAGLDVIWSSRFDLFTALRYIPGTAVLRGSGQGIELGTTAHLLSLETRARYWLLPPAGRLSWEVHTGVGAAFGGTRDFGDLFDHSLVSGAIGTLLRYQVFRQVSVQVQVQERVFRMQFGGADAGNSRRPLRITFGIDLPAGLSPWKWLRAATGEADDRGS